MLTKKGGPEVLERVEVPLPDPGPGEVRVKIHATGVGGTDITMRRGGIAIWYGFVGAKEPFAQVR